jgi:hypothetical protein
MITRLPVLTEVDRSMSPLEELDDSTKRTRKVARGRFVLICVGLESFLQWPRVYIYTLGKNTSPRRLRLHDDIWKKYESRSIKSSRSPMSPRVFSSKPASACYFSLPERSLLLAIANRMSILPNRLRNSRPPDQLPNAPLLFIGSTCHP